MMVIGIDAHKRSHTAVTIDEMGRAGVAKTVGTTTQDHLLLRWASGVGEERLPMPITPEINDGATAVNRPITAKPANAAVAAMTNTERTSTGTDKR